jgi:chorismate mutase
MAAANPVSPLRHLRESIDNIDAAIIHMLAERFRYTRAIGNLKAQRRLPSRDPVSESEQTRRLRQLAVASKLDPAFGEQLLAFVVCEVVRQHEPILRPGDNRG